MARSSDPGKLADLADLLNDENTLHAWDHPDDYLELDPRSLALAGVLNALADNPSPEAVVVLEDLAESELYTGNDARILLLAEALGRLPVLSPNALDFWRSQTGPGSIFNGIVFDAAVRQGGSDAAGVAGEILENDGIGDHEKIAWLRRSVVAHRNQVGINTEAQSLLSGSSLSEALREALIETLFVYRPDEWYGPDAVVALPAEDAYSDAAVDARARLARMILDDSAVDGELRSALEAAARG
jgi:hypothetical protein